MSMSETIADKVRQLSANPDRQAAVAALVALAATDRPGLEAERDRVAVRLHGHSDDYQATATLSLLNQALAESGWHDPYRWKQRTGKVWKRP
jgi:hypothetical protein